jgi:hypothetical protein
VAKNWTRAFPDELGQLLRLCLTIPPQIKRPRQLSLTWPPGVGVTCLFRSRQEISGIVSQIWFFDYAMTVVEAVFARMMTNCRSKNA